MSRFQRTNREIRKEARLTPKEKKAAKKAKKRTDDFTPLIAKQP